MKKNILLIFLLPFIITNCKDNPKPEFFIDQNTKDYCVFKEGSWWLYKEEGSAEKDCVWVTQSNAKKMKSSHIENIRNGIQMITFSTWWGKQITCWAGGDEDIPEKNIFQERIVFPLALEDYTFFSTIDTSAEYAPYFGYKLQLLDTLNIYNIDGKDFKNIKIFNVNIGLHQHWQKKIYRAKHIGKIRYEKGDGSIWNLINYKVEQ
jgi:hypothetical protein